MNGLAAALIALAALFADRAVRGRNRAVILGGLRTDTDGGSSRRPIPAWASVASAGLVGWVVAAIPGAVGAALTVVIARRVRRRRRLLREVAQLHEQLADAVRTIVAGLRAGLSIPQALAYAAREVQPPLSVGLSTLVDGLEAGVPFDQALDDWAAEDGTVMIRDWWRACSASIVGPEEICRWSSTGSPTPSASGSQPDARCGRSRPRRVSPALSWGSSPSAFFGILWLTSRQDIEAALGSAAGLFSVSLGLVLEAGAFLWIRRLLEVR